MTARCVDTLQEISLSLVLCTLLCFGWLVQKGDLVIVKGFNKRAKVVRTLDKPHAQNDWRGWVEIDPPLNGFSRYHKDELEVVRVYRS